MKLTIELRSNPDYVYYKIVGSLNLESFVEVATEVGELVTENKIVRVLADYRDVVSDIHMASVFEMPDQLEKLGMLIETKTAVLYRVKDDSTESYEMFKMLAHSRAFIIELFTDEALALKWLIKK